MYFEMMYNDTAKQYLQKEIIYFTRIINILKGNNSYTELLTSWYSMVM